MPYREHLRDCKIASLGILSIEEAVGPCQHHCWVIHTTIETIEEELLVEQLLKEKLAPDKKNISLVCSIAEVVKLFMFPVAFLGLRLQAYLDLLQILIGYKLGCLVLFQSSTPQISKKSSNFGSVRLLLTFPVSWSQTRGYQTETWDKWELKTLTHWWWHFNPLLVLLCFRSIALDSFVLDNRKRLAYEFKFAVCYASYFRLIVVKEVLKGLIDGRLIIRKWSAELHRLVVPPISIRLIGGKFISDSLFYKDGVLHF